MSLSIDDLLAKAEAKKRKVRCENDSRVLRYLENTKLEPGVLKVPTYVIYWHYRVLYTYPGIFNQNKAKKVTFFRTFSKRFPQVRKKFQRYYLLNPDQLAEIVHEIEPGVFAIKPEVLETAKAYDNQYGQPKQPKVKKKRVQSLGQEGNSPDSP